MGLKISNYKVKRMNNYIITNAYAYITECHSYLTSGYAMIGVFADRQSAEAGAEPFELKRVDFTVERNENDRHTAYRMAKIPKTTTIEKDGKIEVKIIDNMFADWVDDIV